MDGGNRTLQRAAVALLSVVMALALAPAEAHAVGVSRPPRPAAPNAKPGRGPVKVAIPLAAQPRHGFKPGERAPVDPPHLRGTAAVHKLDGGPGPGTGPTATNLSLLPGLATGDTSLY